MPPKKFYRKRYFPKRKFKKTSNAKKMMGHRGANYLKTFRSVMKWANVARNMINCEKKYVDVQDTSAPGTSGAVAVLLNGIPEGDESSQRNGRSVLADSLHVRWAAKIGASATNTILKFVLVCDKKPDATTSCSYGDVYGSLNVTAQIDKVSEGDRYVILRQFSVKLNAGTGLAQTGDTYISLKGIHQKFDGTTNTLASIESNALFMVAMSDEGTNFPSLNIYSRYSYYDN